MKRVRFGWITGFCLFAWMLLPMSCEKMKPEDPSKLSSITDFDGNIYHTLKIGDQRWMMSNLKTTHYADGTDILFVTRDEDWEALDSEAKAYCYYDNSSNAEAFTYGALYTWAAAMDGSESPGNGMEIVQGVCPDGWHIPSDNEWKEMEKNLGMGTIDADTTGPRGISIGSQLAVNRDLWTDGLLEDNPLFGSSGFKALPGGGRRFNGTFGHVHDNANFWTATEADDTRAWGRHIYAEYTTVHRYRNVKSDGFSVRCVQDEE